MTSPVAIFDAACGVVATEDNRVTEWRDARHGSGSGSGDDGDESSSVADWKLVSPTSTAPTLISEPDRRPHLLFQGNHWLTQDNHEVNGFKMDYEGEGSVLAIVVKNDRGYPGYHELFGSVGRAANAQVRFESPTELMVFPVHNFFTINPSTDRFHSYVFRCYKGGLEVYQDGIEVPSKSGKPARSSAPPRCTRMAAIGCWFSKFALHGRISYISYYDSALKENESDWGNLLSTIGRVCDESNAGWTFEAVPTVMPPAAAQGQTSNEFGFLGYQPSSAVNVLTFGSPPPSVGTPAAFSNPPPVVSAPNIGNPPPWAGSAAIMGLTNGAFLPNLPPGSGLFGITAPSSAGDGGVAAPRTRPVGNRPKAKPAWRAVFDGSTSLSLLSSLGEADDRTDSAEPRPSLVTSFLPTSPALYMLNDGITYRFIQSKADELEEQYGDETLIKTVDAFCDVLSHYFAPSLATEEIKQWQALWMVASGQNENVLSGVSSEEELLRAYYFRYDASDSCPHEFVLLHRDSSGECFAHGECALFVSYRDACAHKRHAESAVPLYAVPLAYGSYGDRDLTWSSFLPDVEAVSGLLAQMQKLLKRTSRDTIFCSD